MQRIAFPADVCGDPGARYHRTLNAAFPCGPAEAECIHRAARPTRWGLWFSVFLVAVLLVLVALIVRGQPTTPTPQPEKLAAASARACDGMHAEWLDAKTVQCFKVSAR